MPTFVADDGARLHVDLRGADALPALVALAGGPARHPDYLGDLAGVAGAARSRLAVPHQRGVGRSPGGRERMSAWAQADDVAALVAHLGLDRAVVLAHSAGCRLALATAVRHPDRVGALVLVTPPALVAAGGSDLPALEAARAGDPVFRAAAAACRERRDVADDAAFTAWQHDMAPTTYARWGEAEQAHALAGRWYLDAGRAYRGPAEPDLAAHLAEVTVPVLVVLGAADCAVGVVAGRALAAALPDGRAAVLADSGHYPWVEQPAAFRAAVDPFLAGLDLETFRGSPGPTATPRAEMGP